MALTKAERLSISSKVVGIPLEAANADKTIATIEVTKAKAELEDAGNKKLMDEKTVLINEYQKELELLDGNSRKQLTEQDMVDSANHILQNNFFPNDLNTPLPSIADGVWKLFPPFAGNAAVGKTYVETYPQITKEQDIIDAINGLISTLESRDTLTERTTGQECSAGNLDAGVCSPDGGELTEAACTTAGGTWTSIPEPDSIDPKPDTQADMASLKTEVQNWENQLNNEKTAIQAANAVDTDAGRTASNDTAIADIDAAIAVINTWQAVLDFFTAHGADDCDEFNDLDPNDGVCSDTMYNDDRVACELNGETWTTNKFPATKLALADIIHLKDELAARAMFIATRLSELVAPTYLGSVTQDLTTGAIQAADGFYGSRFRIIDMRLNLMAGSLNKALGLAKSISAQNELKGSNASATIALADVVSATAFRAPASGSPTIHVLDGSLFTAGDAAYVAANSQDEIAVNIISVSGNTIFLDTKIPKKYRQNDGARLYKEL